MKRVAVSLTVALLLFATANVYSGSLGTKQHPRDVGQRQEKIYNSRGQLQQTIKRDSSGNLSVYDSRGQLQQTIKRDSSGDEKVYDNRGQLREYIKPN